MTSSSSSLHVWYSQMFLTFPLHYSRLKTERERKHKKSHKLMHSSWHWSAPLWTEKETIIFCAVFIQMNNHWGKCKAAVRERFVFTWMWCVSRLQPSPMTSHPLISCHLQQKEHTSNPSPSVKHTSEWRWAVQRVNTAVRSHAGDICPSNITHHATVRGQWWRELNRGKAHAPQRERESKHKRWDASVYEVRW